MPASPDNLIEFPNRPNSPEEVLKAVQKEEEKRNRDEFNTNLEQTAPGSNFKPTVEAGLLPTPNAKEFMDLDHKPPVEQKMSNEAERLLHELTNAPNPQKAIEIINQAMRAFETRKITADEASQIYEVGNNRLNAENGPKSAAA